MNFKKILIFIFGLLFFHTSFAAINMAITPIKYEIETKTGTIITKEAKLTNNSEQTFHIITGKSDFVANGTDGKPKFIRKSEEVFEQELSNWITIDTQEFDIAPHETKTIHFTIQVPENATPGGHYGAIFFKNKNSENSSGAQIGINIDYGILILLKVKGEIITDINIGEPIINTGHSGKIIHMDVCNGQDQSGDYYDGKCFKEENNHKNEGKNNKADNNTKTGILNDNKKIKEENSKKNNLNTLQKDNCIIDLTASRYDGKCINKIDEIVKEITGNIEEIDFSKETKNNNFGVSIEIPIDNKGNTHVKPKGKITLIDENGKQLKGVGKEIITNKKGAIIGEKIVDYVPFNDIGGNILPNTKRNYKSFWKGFPYKTYDEEGNIIIKYWNPSEYYSYKALNKHKFLMPWERVCKDIKNKKITAKFDITYPNSDGENIEFNSAKDFSIQYTQEYIGLNPYFFALLFIILFILFLLFMIFKKKKKICINKKCKKKIDYDLKICPYCETKQNKKTAIITKNKLKTKSLDLQTKIINTLLDNKLIYAKDVSNMSKQELLEIKGIGEKAIQNIKKALKKEGLKLKK